MNDTLNRLLIACGGLAGASGVALSAMAAHSGGPNLGTAASMLLAHAAALLVAALLPGRLAVAGGWGLVAGLLLFCGDLVVRDLAGQRLFPYAAPAGGILLIGSWLVLAASALAARNRNVPRAS